jgi:hypothetical protein
MTREEAMTLLTRLHLIHTGMTGAGIELLIQIVQAGAAAEREACAKMLDDNWFKTQSECAAAIRARGQT